MPLSDAAKEEVRNAIAIVRQDKFEKFARTTLSKHTPTLPTVTEVENELETTAPKEGAEAPPQKEKVVDEPTPKRRDAWWGELED